MNARMLHVPIVAACLGLVAGVRPPQVGAQQTPELGALQLATSESERSALIRPGIPASDGELSEPVKSHVVRGDALTGRFRHSAAQREYLEAAAIARQHGHLPSLTLWHLASALYYQGDPQRAAVVMEQLAAEAARYGDLGVEALALYNAVWLNGLAGRGRIAAKQVADLSNLLRSPHMPVAVREHLTARLNPSGAVAVTR